MKRADQIMDGGFHAKRIVVVLAMASFGEVVSPLDVVCTVCNSDIGERCTAERKVEPWKREEAA